MLLVGAILAPGQRTVTSILRVSGLARERCFVNYHRVLNRAAWSGREAARVLLGLLLAAFAPRGPVILGLDRYGQDRGRRHKQLTDWGRQLGRQLVLQARRWLPGRSLVLVTDSGFAALEFLAALARRNVTCITRLRLDAALDAPAPPRAPGTVGRPRTKGARLPPSPRCWPTAPRPGPASLPPAGMAKAAGSSRSPPAGPSRRHADRANPLGAPA